MRITLFLLLSCSALGQGFSGYRDMQPVISNVASSPSASTIVATWQTNSIASSVLACGTVAGTYNISAVDSGLIAQALHQNIVAGLAASTTYFCQITSANTAGTTSTTFSVATTAAAATTPITGVTYGAIQSINSLSGTCQMNGDTFYNARANDGKDYFTTDDTSIGFAGCGTPTGASNMQVDAFTGTFPTTGHTVNQLTTLGVNGSLVPPDNLSMKNSGVFAMGGMLFMTVGRQLNTGNPAYVQGNPLFQHHGELMWSPSKGQDWNNFQSPGFFSATGSLTTAAMFGTTPSEWSSAAFVMYCGDDGTLGYLSACNRHDNGEAYVYLIANENCWNNCGHYYIARVPRVKLANLSVGDYQYFTGGDGNLSSNWSSTASAAVAIVTAANQASEPSVQYVPALNRYILLGYYYPQFSSSPSPVYSQHTVWPVYEAPHPWGPWTLVSSLDIPTLGWYNPTILNSTIWTGLTPTIMFAGDYVAGTNYNLNYQTMTILH